MFQQQQHLVYILNKICETSCKQSLIFCQQFSVQSMTCDDDHPKYMQKHTHTGPTKNVKLKNVRGATKNCFIKILTDTHIHIRVRKKKSL